MKIKFLILLSLLLLLISCKKDKKEIRYFPIPDTLKTIGLFNKESYWVFQNDSTSSIDCTFVKSDISVGTLLYTYNDNIEYSIDYLTIPLQSSIFSSFVLSGKLGNLSTSEGYPFLTNIIGYSHGCNLGNASFILHNDTLSNHRGENIYKCGDDPKFPIAGGDRFTELGEFSSLKVNDLIFQKVRLTRSEFYSSGNCPYDTIYFYFSPGVGIVKYVHKTGNAYSGSNPCTTISYSLKRFRIIN